MNKTGILLVSMLIPLLLAGCGRQSANSGVQKATSAATTSAQSGQGKASNSGLLNIPVANTGSATATRLMASQSISGTVTVNVPGRIDAFDVQIGNYGDSSDGVLGVKLCQRNKCASGTSPIKGSQDNSYMNIRLSRSIDLVTGESLKYVISRVSGDKPFAVWTYADKSSKMKMPNGSLVARTPKVALRYQK